MIIVKFQQFIIRCFLPIGLSVCVFAAIEGPGLGGMKLPIGMTRRALSYDDNLEAPMSTPPHDININKLWRRPMIPERRFTHLAEVTKHRVHKVAMFKWPQIIGIKVIKNASCKPVEIGRIGSIWRMEERTIKCEGHTE